jgi:hypothetical protein
VNIASLKREHKKLRKRHARLTRLAANGALPDSPASRDELARQAVVLEDIGQQIAGMGTGN